MSGRERLLDVSAHVHIVLLIERCVLIQSIFDPSSRWYPLYARRKKAGTGIGHVVGGSPRRWDSDRCHRSKPDLEGIPMDTAIIGAGKIGSRVATNLVNGGERVIVADRTLAKAEQLATRLGDTARAMSVPDAIRNAEAVVLAVYFDAEKQLIAEFATELRGKIVIDPSNPIGPDGKGGFSKTIPEDQSSGQIIASLLPDGARFVKAFGTLTAESLEAEANRSAKRVALFYATDDQDAGAVVERLIEASGHAPVLVGGVNRSIRIEVGGDLHQVGGLGRPVSAAEASAKV